MGKASCQKQQRRGSYRSNLGHHNIEPFAGSVRPHLPDADRQKMFISPKTPLPSCSKCLTYVKLTESNERLTKPAWNAIDQLLDRTTPS